MAGGDGKSEVARGPVPAAYAGKYRWALIPIPRRIEGRDRLWTLLLSMPLILILAIFFIAPFSFIVLYGFGFYTAINQPSGGLSLINFASIWNKATRDILLLTSAVAAAVTALSLVLAYPAAYFIAEQPERRRSFLVMLLIIPFWTSFLLRTYSLMTIFSENGIANQVLGALGIQGSFRTGNLWSVVWAETYTFLPFMVLPLYATLERMDRSSVEASYILGAGRFQTFFRVVLPLSAPGILAGSLLVFIIAMGELVIPFLVGGIEGQFLIGNAIYQLQGTSPGIAAALSLVLMAITLTIALVYIRIVGREGLRL